MALRQIKSTDLILNDDGSVYHLNLLPEDIANTIITVGDPDRVAELSKYFDEIELKKSKREFITHTGRIGKHRISVISTGIGTGNIDIVLNELDALKNVDLKTRFIKPDFQKLNIIRIGTSGAIQKEIPVNSILISSAAFGLDNVIQFYQHQPSSEERACLSAFEQLLPSGYTIKPYYISAGKELFERFSKDFMQGITITAPGFYAPQGRTVRALHSMPLLMDLISAFNFDGKKIANLEMETAGIYGLASVLGHQAISFNVILANRATDEFSKDPAGVMDRGIKEILGSLF